MLTDRGLFPSLTAEIHSGHQHPPHGAAARPSVHLHRVHSQPQVAGVVISRGAVTRILETLRGDTGGHWRPAHQTHRGRVLTANPKKQPCACFLLIRTLIWANARQPSARTAAQPGIAYVANCLTRSDTGRLCLLLCAALPVPVYDRGCIAPAGVHHGQHIPGVAGHHEGGDQGKGEGKRRGEGATATLALASLFRCLGVGHGAGNIRCRAGVCMRGREEQDTPVALAPVAGSFPCGPSDFW